MKNKLAFLLISWLTCSLSLWAQDNTQNSIFWEISGKNIQKPSYLFGTHHLHDYKFIEKNDLIQQSIQNIDVLFGEIVIDTNAFRIAMKLAAVMRMKDNTLDNLLSSEDFKATDKCLREYMGIGLITLNNIKPIFVYQLIMVAKFMKNYEKQSGVSLQSMDNPTSNSMDAYFQQRAKSLKKEIKGLESVDDQLKVLYEDYPLQRQVEMLLEIVYDKGGNSTNELLELSNLYNQQNLSGLLEIMQRTAKEEELKVLLVERNKAWIPQIEALLNSSQNGFIAVGAGHLPGKFGIIQLLRDKGYVVNPIKIVVEGN